MRSSSLNLLKQAEKNPEKVLKKFDKLEENVKESPKDVISINDPDAHLMMNKKGNSKKTISATMQELKPIFAS